MIGVFDSGVGGLSVLREIRRLMPDADLTYVADRARAPYGLRSLSEVKELSLSVAHQLLELGATSLVVACNTASAAALESLRGQFPGTPVVGMEPAVKPAAIASASGVIGVFATTATFQGELFEAVVSKHASDIRVISTTCPDWVEMVERGEIEGKDVENAVRARVEAVVDDGADTLVLGCTHFSFLKPSIAKIAGPDIRIIDPAPAVAAQASRVADEVGGGSLTFMASGNLGEFEFLIDSLTELERPGPALPFPS